MSDWKKHDCLEWRTEGIGCRFCSDMVLAGQEVGAAFDEGEAKGRRDILRRMAQLPSPWHQSARLPECVCDWCGIAVAADGDYAMPTHPPNGCIWPEAVEAAKGAK